MRPGHLELRRRQSCKAVVGLGRLRQPIFQEVPLHTHNAAILTG